MRKKKVQIATNYNKLIKQHSNYEKKIWSEFLIISSFLFVPHFIARRENLSQNEVP